MTGDRRPYESGVWMAWQHDSSYRQDSVHVFGNEIDALRWSQEQKHHGYNVSFVPFGDCPRGCDECGLLPDPTIDKGSSDA